MSIDEYNSVVRLLSEVLLRLARHHVRPPSFDDADAPADVAAVGGVCFQAQPSLDLSAERLGASNDRTCSTMKQRLLPP